MASSRASASSRSAGAPATTIHESFSCGSASSFEAPESTKWSGASWLSSSRLGRRVPAGAGPCALSANTSSETSASSSRPRTGARSAARRPPGARRRRSGCARGPPAARAHAGPPPRARARRASMRKPSPRRTQRVAARLDALEPGQEVEERVAGPRHQHALAGVGEQAEEVRVALAGPRRQQHALGVDRRSAAGVVARDRLARGARAARIGLVAPDAVRRAPPRPSASRERLAAGQQTRSASGSCR